MVKNLKIGNYRDANISLFPFKKQIIDFKIWKKKNIWAKVVALLNEWFQNFVPFY